MQAGLKFSHIIPVGRVALMPPAYWVMMSALTCCLKGHVGMCRMFHPISPIGLGTWMSTFSLSLSLPVAAGEGALWERRTG